jgi:hypothetical protein
MNKLLATVALATLIASPAFAQNPPKGKVKHATTTQQSQSTAFGRSEGRAQSDNMQVKQPYVHGTWDAYGVRYDDASE